MPGVVFAFHPHVYAGARFIIPVDPQASVVLFPGVGVIHTFKNAVSPLLEVNLLSDVGKEEADFGVAVTVGVLLSF